MSPQNKNLIAKNNINNINNVKKVNNKPVIEFCRFIKQHKNKESGSDVLKIIQNKLSILELMGGD